MKSFLYVLGDNPYDNSHGDYHTEGNGEWFTNATNVDEALKIILSNMPFPGEPVGRKFFLDTVSLTGVSDREIIQVWSSEPEIIKRTEALLKSKKQNGVHDGLHNGNGVDFGLHMEIKVTDINKYLAPNRTLLTDSKTSDSGPVTALSPMGASLIQFGEMQHEMQQALQHEQMQIAKKQWEIESVEGDMESRLKVMNQKLAVLNTYLHGTRHRTQLTTGNRGTGKYSVFQTRMFLSEEVSILGNFENMDFKDMENLEKWLIKSGRIWKLLPFDRCILATRIRKEKKDYGNDPIANIYDNMANMQNMIWIRDGQNVCHVDVEFDFHHAVFPDRDQFDRALRVCQNHIWNACFKEKPPTDWQGHKLKKGEYDVMGKMRRKPLEEEEPYFTRKILKDRFYSIKKWLDSDCYAGLLDRQLRDAVGDYLREINQRQMVFAVLLQGIVDNTQLLDIPPGTNLFEWTAIDKYFDLIYDYTRVLPWSGNSDKIAPYLDGKVSKGDWIATIVEEYKNGTSYEEGRPILFKVVGTEEVEIERMTEEIGGREKIKVIKPVVKYHPKVTRRRRDLDYWEAVNARRKEPINLVLKSSRFIRMPLPPSLAEKILDDRNWKKDNQWAVPLMVNYSHVLAAFKKQVNATIVKWDKNED